MEYVRAEDVRPYIQEVFDKSADPIEKDRQENGQLTGYGYFGENGVNPKSIFRIFRSEWVTLDLADKIFTLIHKQNEFRKLQVYEGNAANTIRPKKYRRRHLAKDFPPAPEGMKICFGHLKALPLSAFYKDRHSAIGYRPYCKECLAKSVTYKLAQRRYEKNSRKGHEERMRSKRKNIPQDAPFGNVPSEKIHPFLNEMIAALGPTEVARRIGCHHSTLTRARKKDHMRKLLAQKILIAYKEWRDSRIED